MFNPLHAELINTVGPNNGTLFKNPKFATEVVYDKATKKLDIFLLDENLKNPTTENSAITFFYNANGSTTEINCLKLQNHFSCDVSKINMQKGNLEIRSYRNKIEIKEYSIYPLPLK